ncbi:hypothetical protein [Alkalinema sp. FACHB-956]|uniref:hypothetical protein n=1 Tax=Alkalinema sp. FACHB-956 TaxID=2692768 RepID=UPI001682E28E|nr:hypothetical protein [Alkalinema sp. FACHB-956]MBD2329428.1 hypothetical protein [Alkalinema sp. FACHB-956]
MMAKQGLGMVQGFGMVMAIVVVMGSPGMMVQSAGAAIPPLSDQKLREYSTHIVIGQVMAIRSKEVAVPYGKNYDHAAKVKIATLEKSQSMQLKAGKVIEVYYTTIKERESGWAGPQRQSRSLKRGEKVKLFLSQGQDGKFYLLEPNGWEPIE